LLRSYGQWTTLIKEEIELEVRALITMMMLTLTTELFRLRLDGALFNNPSTSDRRVLA